MYNRDYESSFEELLTKDKALSFLHRNIHHVAIEMFKVKNDLSPPFMKDIFEVIEGGSRSGDDFRRPNINSVKKGCRSLRHFGPIVWTYGIIWFQINANHAKRWTNLRYQSRTGNQKTAPMNSVTILFLGLAGSSRMSLKTVIFISIDFVVYSRFMSIVCFFWIFNGILYCF